MTILRRNLKPGSSASSPYNTYRVTLPGADFFGIAAAQTVSVGNKLTLSGSYCRNISTDGFSADLRLPVCPTIILSDHTLAVSLKIDGIDHLGRPVTMILDKTAANTLMGGQAYTCLSRINQATVISKSGTTDIGLGFCYGSWDSTTYFPVARRASSIDGIRRIPLPVLPGSASDVLAVRCLGPSSGNGQLINIPTKTATLTYAATTVTSGSVGDFGSVAQFDVLYTADGYVGVATGAAVAGVVTVVAWVRNGATGTPGNWTGNANTSGGIVAVRYAYQTALGTATIISSATPGVDLAGQVANGSLVGVNAAGASYGFYGDVVSEPLFDMDFLVTYKPGTVY